MFLLRKQLIPFLGATGEHGMLGLISAVFCIKKLSRLSSDSLFSVTSVISLSKSERVSLETKVCDFSSRDIVMHGGMYSSIDGILSRELGVS